MNSLLLILIVIAFIFSLWAQWQVKSNYKRYSTVLAGYGLTAGALARKLLDNNNLTKIPVRAIAGELSDNYDPLKKELNLSEGVYNSTSIAAYGIAAHEVGHALQHANAFAPLMLRNAFYPAANIGSNLAIPLFFLGMIFSLPLFMNIGILFFAGAVFFSVITLPVEFDASHRALVTLGDSHFLNTNELPLARKVLGAAALTYLAATLMVVLQLLRLLVLRNSRED